MPRKKHVVERMKALAQTPEYAEAKRRRELLERKRSQLTGPKSTK
jgi:hypothetical protein